MADQEYAALQTDALIELYIIDLSKVSVYPNPQEKLYITNGLDKDRSNLEYDGNEYTPVPVESEGFEINSTGAMPRPTITIGNVDSGFNDLLKAYGNLLGAELTRYQVFYEYLDGKDKGGIGAYKAKDVWTINRKVVHNKTQIKFELKNPLDLENVLVPKGQFTRKCEHTYRVWDVGTQSFIQGSCPYTDETHTFDELGNKCSKQNDVCGKRYTDCAIRFNAVDKKAPVQGLFFPLIPKF
jgi:lambda family phage minor tail protein L